MNLAQRVAVNTSVQLGGQVAGILVALVTLRVTTGYLGVDAFGELAIVLAIGGLVVTLSELGVTTALARELAKAPQDADRLAGSLLCFRLLSSLALVLVMLLAIPVLPYASQTKLALAVYLVAVLAQSLATFPKAFFQTNLKLHLQAAVDLTTRVLALVAVSVVAVLDLGLYALVGGLAMVSVAGFMLSFRFLIRFWRPVLRWDAAVGRTLARSALAIGAVSIVGLLTFQADAILLSLLAPPREVGIYAVAFRFIDTAFILPGLFIAAVFPIFARLVHEGPGRVDGTVNRSFQVLALGSIAVAVAIFSLARPVVLLVAGADFEEAVVPARILAFCVPFIFCAPVFYNLAIAANRQRSLVWVGLASLAFNLAANLALIPPYTYNGAAAAALLTAALSFALSAWVGARAVTIRFEWRFLAKAFATAIAAAAPVALLLPTSDLVAFVVAELSFLAMAFLVGAVRNADIRLVLGRERPAQET